MNILGKYALPLIKTKNNVNFKFYSTFTSNLNDYRKQMRDSLLNRKKEENKILLPAENTQSKEPESIKEAFHSELKSPEDLLIDIRAKGKFERNLEDKNTKYLDYIYGYLTVLSVLQGGHRKLLSLYLSEKYLHNQSKRIERLIKLAKIRGLEIEYRSEENLDSFTAGRIHDGVIIKAEFRDFNHIKKNSKFLESLKKRTGNIIVLLDKVIDIQNYGSIARTCFYYGVDYLIVNKAHRPAISPALCQISLGACENMDLYCLKNFYPFIQEAKKWGFKIITTSLKSDKSQLKENFLPNDLPIDSRDNVLVIFGSESKGLEEDVYNLANYNVIIPPFLGSDISSKNDASSIVDSLNVGVSSGIIIHSIKVKLT